MKPSWKTTVGGVITFLFLVTGQLQHYFDSDPATVCDWSIIIAAFGALWTGLTARDSNKSDEESAAGVK